MITPPKAPEHLSNLAKEEWRRLAGDLFGDNPDRRHLKVFEMYCTAYAMWREAKAAVESEGLTEITPNGHRQPHPSISTHNQAMDRCHKLAVELGLTPMSRAKIETSHKKKEEKDPWELLKASRSKASKRLDA